MSLTELGMVASRMLVYPLSYPGLLGLLFLFIGIYKIAKVNKIFGLALGAMMLYWLFSLSSESLGYFIIFYCPFILVIATLIFLARKIKKSFAIKESNTVRESAVLEESTDQKKSNNPFEYLGTGMVIGIIAVLLISFLPPYIFSKIYLSIFGPCSDFVCLFATVFYYIMLLILGGIIGIPIAIILKESGLMDKVSVVFGKIKALWKQITITIIFIALNLFIFSGLMGIVTKNASFCGLAINSGIKLRDECYFDVALSTKNCDLLVKTKEKDSCLRWVANSTNNPSLCKKISTEESSKICIEGVRQMYGK